MKGGDVEGAGIGRERQGTTKRKKRKKKKKRLMPEGWIREWD